MVSSVSCIYGLGRPESYEAMQIALHVGDVVNRDDILRELVGPMTGHIFWDIPGPNTVAQRLAEQLGFHPIRELTRMTLGQMQCMPDVSMQFAIAAPETG